MIENNQKLRRKKKLPEYLPLNDINKLIDRPPKTRMDHRLMMQTGFKCGLRVSEICAIKKNHINLMGRTLRVVEGKGAKDRELSVPQELIEEFEKYFKTFKLSGDDLLFEGYTQKKVDRFLKKYAKESGVERRVYPHIMRHSFAVHSIKAGRNLRTVQKMLGHTHLSSTEIYLQVTGEDMEQDTVAHPLPY